MSDIKHFFRTRQVEMSDNSILFELVTDDGERVATASKADMLEELEMNLNLALTEAAEQNSDLLINMVGG